MPVSPHPVARVVFDPESRADRLPLYVDGRIEVSGRSSARVSEATTVSFGSYFNAFPAWHWHEYTSAREVLLTIELVGRGKLTVHRSDRDGASSVVERRDVDGGFEESVRLDLAPNADGGWLWFDLRAEAGGLELRGARWELDILPRETRLATLSMTTMDKADFALGVLGRIAGEPAALAALDEVIVVDQGKDKIADHGDFAETSAALGGRLRVIDQANFGGSGGFSRGMLETLDAGTSGSVILLDDDVELEPESIARAVAFASYTTGPTIVGGHFFDLYRPLQLHAFSEAVSTDDFDWGPVGPGRQDFGADRLRSTPWLHAPARPDYNGWWFCLLPVDIIRSVGLSLPAFLKWDDAEFGLRAGAAGFPTATLPGMAVWHITWLDKNDSLGWQSFYHARNRLLAALVDARAPGSLLARKNFALDLRYLLTMDYHVVELRHLAYESILAGPGSLHPELATRLGEVRATMSAYPSGIPVPLDGASPSKAPQLAPLSGARLGLTAARLALVHATTPSGRVPEEPEARVAYSEARWWQLARYRHVLAVSSDESAYQRHRLDPRTFRRMLRRAVADRRRMGKEWGRLGAEYRRALPELVAPDTWRATLGLD